MAKHINLGTINEVTFNACTDYVQAIYNLTKINSKFREEKAVIEKRIEAILRDREADLAQGIPVEEVTRKYSTIEENNKLRALMEKKKKDSAPWDAQKKDSLAVCPENIYEAYKSAMEKGVMDGFVTCTEAFLKGAGIDATETATVKFAQKLCVRTAGMRTATSKDRENGLFVSNKSKKSFSELFLAAFIDICVNEKGVLDYDKSNGTLTRHNFGEVA